MKCNKCNSDLFKIEEIKDCTKCEHNGAYVDGEYIYDKKRILDEKLERTQAEEEGECAFDSCFNAGCYMFTCAECGKQTNLPIYCQ